MSNSDLPFFNVENASGHASQVRDALSELRAQPNGDGTRSLFDAMFGPASREAVCPGGDTRLAQSLANLQQAGLVECEEGDWHSHFAMAAYPSGSLYLSDRPRRHPDEVFSAHFEQKAFVDLLQVRNGDEVLDLCTGNGVLALEAARRGAGVLGIDMNERAIAFARFNAILNEVEGNARFEVGDVCDPESYRQWGRPDVVLSNPPFEPAPHAMPHHSCSGIDGTHFLARMVRALAAWDHVPNITQFVLFSISAGIDARAWGAADAKEAFSSLLKAPYLEALARRSSSLLEVKELAPPVGIADLGVLQGGEFSAKASANWCEQLRSAGSIPDGAQDSEILLHLIVATLYYRAGGCSRPPTFSSWARRHEGEECFILPLDPSRNASAASVLESYLASLTMFRESENKGKVIDLNLHDPAVARFLAALARSSSLFGPVHDLTILDIRADTPPERTRALIVPSVGDAAAGTAIQLEGRQRIVDHIAQGSRQDMSATICDVVKSAPYIRSSLASGAPDDIIFSFFELPSDAIQRFVAVSPWPAAALSPMRQVVISNLLSELCFTAQHVAASNYTLAEAVAHEYKNRTSPLADLSISVKSELEKCASISPVLRAKILAMIGYGQMLNAMSKGLLDKVRENKDGDRLAKLPRSERKALLHAAARLMLHLKSLSGRDRKLVVEDNGMSLEQAMAKLSQLVENRRRDREVEITDLANNMAVGRLCLVVAEVINNIRPDVRPGWGAPNSGSMDEVWAWVDAEEAIDEVRIYQRTVEHHVMRRPIPSKGVDTVNRLLPDRFANPGRNVIFVSAEKIPNSKAKLVTRYTPIFVHSLPAADE